jgi:hypothetical protein
MTNQHPITPPPELLQQWATEYWGNPGESIGCGEKYIATQAARWGADQRGAATEAELQEARDKEQEACSAWLVLNGYGEAASRLRAARRPKPPSEADRAIDELVEVFNREKIDETTYNIIRKQLKRLQELEALPND